MQELPDNKNIVIRSHSEDVDINVLANSLFQGIWLSEMKLYEDERKSLLGLHAFTGNDYISLFFRKSKFLCWKIMKLSDKFKIMFRNLGNTWTITNDSLEELAEYICKLYGYNEKSVDNVRYKMFQKKHLK